MEIVFTEIAEQDLPVIREIYNWYVVHSTATFHLEPVETDEMKAFLYLGHPLYRSYLIRLASDTAGYCLLTHFRKREAYNRTAEVTLYLKPEFCHKGIGKIVLARLEQDARSGGIKNLIGVITAENEDSVNLFTRAGYTKCAHYKNVGEKFGRVLDVVALQKEL